ncbi:MAG: Mrp/NBP35 family ATP-binding protein [Candidatus Binatus sp.]|uniref:Mrp/NBP35 family ATP-binding protein n=1 Tax=Candidatus Binatus sp. TaxID=2811406 RepID=UPI00272034AC|nr:Mrp/NBP35 family ATP-binding protein [Candidatus Binatus sp.]MDO8432924.1 Mrp/NBP35 family ATP-binding protein [Candidatus Binatus sp.]
MARQVPIEAVFEALGSVKYPGYSADIVALGIVEAAEAIPTGGYAITLRQATEREEVIRELAARIHQALTHDLGIPKVELRAHRIEAELGEKTGRVRLEGIKHIVAVGSGKGGVGKSTVAANLALALASLGLSVGLLDADIYGPSIPMMFGVGAERPKSAGGQNFYPIEKYGVKMISIGFFLGEKAPIIWRGPMVMGAVRQFLKDTLWGSQDFLIVDLPPGTGDAQLTLAQQVSIDGVVIVTTPQDVALLDANRAVKMFRQVHCPILGVVENMSYFVCPDCGERDELFGEGGGERMAREEGTRVLGRLPIYPEVREAGDAGMPIVIANPKHPASAAFIELARQIVEATSAG